MILVCLLDYGFKAIESVPLSKGQGQGRKNTHMEKKPLLKKVKAIIG